MRVYNPLVVRDTARAYVDSGETVNLSTGGKGSIVGLLSRRLREVTLCSAPESNDARRLVLAYLFSDSRAVWVSNGLSSKELTPSQWYALCRWIGIEQNREAFPDELFRVYHAALRVQALVRAGTDPRQVFEQEKSIPEDAYVDIEPGGIVAAGFQKGAYRVSEMAV